MTSEQHADLMPILILAFDPGIEHMVAEVLALEGYQVQRAHTDAEVRTLLDSHVGNSIILMDNLHVHREGQQFLAELRENPGLRARVKTVSMAAVNDWIRQDFGDVLDAYVSMPLSASQLFDVLASL